MSARGLSALPPVGKVAACLTLAVASVLVVWQWSGTSPSPTPADGAAGSRYRVVPETLARVQAIEGREQEARETVWAPEVLAQECGHAFEVLWDDLNAATNRLLALAAFPVGEVNLGNWTASRRLRHGIVLSESVGPGTVWSEAEWMERLNRFSREGWDLAELEFRHQSFEIDSDGRPRVSGFYVAAQLTQPAREERVVLEGRLRVYWQPRASTGEPVEVQRIDASGLTLKTCRGPAPFQEIFRDRVEPPEHALSVDPVLVYDLDGNGFSEIILPAKNRVYRRVAEGGYASGVLCAHAVGTLYSAILADFDGDNAVDLLAATLQGLVLFSGTESGRFERPGRPVWRPIADWQYPMVITGGDIDRDADLDVFLAQYRVPYEGGDLPSPYYDALDGYPAFLLRNDGRGGFSDVTEAAGLGPKRRRRTYSASLVDLDRDTTLDLVVVSDYAGVDLYRNRGDGSFADCTAEWVADPRAFGMSHTVADFNGDGRLDVLMMGMPSATVDRLEHLGLWRTHDPTERNMRSRMSWGNRLYEARATKGFEQTDLGTSLARSGWSWGAGAFDFDNDGWVDVYVANGMESRSSVKDYESEYWLHDRFVGDGSEDPAVRFYLLGKIGRTRGQGQSYGGYERNRLFLNQEGHRFLDVGHLMGVGFQEDSRNVVAHDLNGDGHVDLVLTSYEDWPDPRVTLRVFENRVTDSGHWIGFRFREQGAGRSPLGAQVEVMVGPRRLRGQIVSGDSYRAQQPPVLHFGIGAAREVDQATVTWLSGEVLRLRQPATDRYYEVEVPSARF